MDMSIDVDMDIEVEVEPVNDETAIIEEKDDMKGGAGEKRRKLAT